MFTAGEPVPRLVTDVGGDGGVVTGAACRFYGTTFKAVTQVSEEGKICVLDIDIQGVRSVKKSDLEPRYVFINPPSPEILEKRLRGRCVG